MKQAKLRENRTLESTTRKDQFRVVKRNTVVDCQWVDGRWVLWYEGFTEELSHKEAYTAVTFL